MTTNGQEGDCKVDKNMTINWTRRLPHTGKQDDKELDKKETKNWTRR